jgi:hypothetical protein
MRTTVEMKPEHRSALIALASKRGHKGFSGDLAEAIDTYLRGEEERDRRKAALLAVGGSLSAKDADHLRRVSRQLRENWR